MAAPRSLLTPRIAVVAVLGLAATGLIAFAALRGAEDGEKAVTAAVAAPEPAIAPSTAPAVAPAAESAAAPASPAPAAPALDLVRVEPDGAVLLAGRAAPNAVVAVRAGEAVLATAEADASGAFVATFDAAPDGPRDLKLSAEGAAAPELALTLPEPEGGFTDAAGETPAAADPALAAAPAPTPAPAAEPSPPVAAPPVEVAAVTPAPDPAPVTPAQTAAVPQSAPLPRPTARPAGADDPATVVVQPGGTLWTLAREHYGAGRRYPVIVSANADEISDPALIFPGQRLVLPPSGRSD